MASHGTSAIIAFQQNKLLYVHSPDTLLPGDLRVWLVRQAGRLVQLYVMQNYKVVDNSILLQSFTH